MAITGKQNETGQLWVEEGESRTAPLVSVAPLTPIDKVYTYTTTDEIAAGLPPVQRVIVPMGRRNRDARAIIVKIDRGPWSSTLKPIRKVLDPAGSLSSHLVALGKWISQYYCSPLGRTLAAMMPDAVRQQRGFVTVRHVQLQPDVDPSNLPQLGAKQRRIIDLLADSGEPIEASQLLASADAQRATLRSLIDKSLVTESVEKRPPETSIEGQPVEPDHTLTDDQRRTVESIIGACDDAAFCVRLLYGVSGSGKTEVYVHAIRHVIAAGKQAIFLVPEIALTTQLVQRLARRFERVAMIHSGLTDAQRSLEWEAIRTGKKQVVIGTRSAVFAPCDKLGLIVVDEEQETSYKNMQSPRFHVRDVAIQRAHMLGIPIVLGSATPSLESWQNVSRHKTWQRIDLPHRVFAQPMPAVDIIDMRMQASADGVTPIVTPELVTALREAIARNEQAVLLLNRRGYAALLQCRTCGQRIGCPNCRTSLVLHKLRGRTVCHYCHMSLEIPTHCPDRSCQGELQRVGSGTERLEEWLTKRLPDARIRRADSDTMKHARHYRQLINAFESHELDILLGTQMIAKGLDFPNVSLVGVIGAEPVSAMSDFRANERLFQLITQVAGRAGRAELPGRVIVQSMTPDLSALRHAAGHDYPAFADAELKRRHMLQLPPAVRMARFVLSGKRDQQTRTEAADLASRLRATVQELAAPIRTPDGSPGQSPSTPTDSRPRLPSGVLNSDPIVTNQHDPTAGGQRSTTATVPQVNITGVTVLGPNPCAIERIRNQYRHEVLLCAPTAGSLLRILTHARHHDQLRTRGTSLLIDVDPVILT